MAPSQRIFPSARTDSGPEQFCRELSKANWHADLGDGPEPDAELLERLHRLHWAARHVLDDHVGSKRLGRDKLEQLQASVMRQAAEARALQDRLAALGCGEAQRAELADLIGYFDTILVAITRQLDA